MVIKSIGRKDTKFGQLLTYLHQDDFQQREAFTYLHNITAKPDDLEGIRQAFHQNNTYRQKRKNGVGQYHEIVSFHPEDGNEVTPEMLEDIARVYLELRAPNALAVARPHVDKEHCHIHFMISANELESRKANRLTKKQFQEIKESVEQYQSIKYPQLTKSIVFSRDKARKLDTKTRSHKEWQMKERGVSKSDKELVKEIFQEAIEQASSLEELQEYLGGECELYEYRGKLTGVVFKERKYRFSRLVKDQPELLKRIQPWLLKSQNRRIQQNYQTKGKEIE